MSAPLARGLRRYRLLGVPFLAIAFGAGAAALGCSGSEESGDAGPSGACEVEPNDAYVQRIQPLLAEERPKSCNQCHLSGVDLSAFVRDTPCESMACLVEGGLVDLSAPEESQILDWIARASPDSELITEQVIQSEYEGFLSWIEASAACPGACAGAECGTPSAAHACEENPSHDAEPAPTPDAPAGCSDAALEQDFFDSVYAARGRCFPCHFQSQPYADASAPRWLSTRGNCATGSAETLRAIVDSGYLDLEDPDSSLLLLKPLAESAGGVEHGGGDKFASTADATYQSFLGFIQRYAACRAP